MTSRNLLRRWLASAAILGALATPLLAPAPAAAADLPEAKPADVGVDPQRLVELSRWLREQNLDVRSLLLVKEDKLAFERYGGGLDRDYNYELYSITKGVTALVAGMLIDEGRLRLEQHRAKQRAEVHWLRVGDATLPAKSLRGLVLWPSQLFVQIRHFRLGLLEKLADRACFRGATGRSIPEQL